MFVRKTPTNQAALLFDDFVEVRPGTMRSGKDFETRTSIWKVREPGCYGLHDQSRAKMAKSSRVMKRARKKEIEIERERGGEQKSFAVSFACFDVRVFAQPLRSLFTLAIVTRLIS